MSGPSFNNPSILTTTSIKGDLVTFGFGQKVDIRPAGTNGLDISDANLFCSNIPEDDSVTHTIGLDANNKMVKTIKGGGGGGPTGGILTVGITSGGTGFVANQEGSIQPVVGSGINDAYYKMYNYLYKMSKLIPEKARHMRNSNNRNGTTYRFQAMNQDKVVDEIFPSCSAIVKKYDEEFGFSRDVLFRLRKNQYKTDYSCYAKDKYKNILKLPTSCLVRHRKTVRKSWKGNIT
jgi:hypothetical protein